MILYRLRMIFIRKKPVL